MEVSTQLVILDSRALIAPYRSQLINLFRKLTIYEAKLLDNLESMKPYMTYSTFSGFVDQLGWVAVATVEGEVVGMIGGSRKTPHQIDMFFIEENFRGKKIGGQLINSFFNQFEAGEQVTVTCFNENTDALRFYESHGFVFKPEKHINRGFKTI